MKDSLAGVTASILAGGLGTRLRTVVSDIPKVLAPVAGVPFLTHLLKQLDHARFREAVLLVGFGADQVRVKLGDRQFGVKLSYSIESEQLGTGGAVRLALSRLPGKTILLMNGDSYCNLDLRRFVDYHTGHGGKLSMAVAWMEDATRFGRVGLGPDDRITHFGEKESPAAPGWINAGIYLIDCGLFENLAPNSNVSLERELLPAWVAKHEVFGFRGEEFIDIGVPESYARAGAFFRSIEGPS